MRKEPFAVDSFIHVVNRGNRKQEIVRDGLDRWRFLQMLYYFNNEWSPPNPFRTLEESLSRADFNGRLVWPEGWRERKPLVKIICFILMENHYHLILKEIRDGGVTSFMRKLGTGMASRFNVRYGESGRLFQGSYKAKHVADDNYFRHLSVYIQIKNAFELYHGGLKEALKNFDKAYKFATKYPYSSLSVYAGIDNGLVAPIIDTDMLGDMYPTGEEYKKLVKQCIPTIEQQMKDKDTSFML